MKGPQMPRTPPHPNRRQAGFALIEILVAILLFALGVLALVGLQGSLTRAQTDAKVRTDAAALAGEVIGQMWGDLTNLSAYSGDGCASHARCQAWQDKVSAALPSGEGTITVDAASGDVEVSLSWVMPGKDKEKEKHQYTTHTSLARAN